MHVLFTLLMKMVFVSMYKHTHTHTHTNFSSFLPFYHFDFAQLYFVVLIFSAKILKFYCCCVSVVVNISFWIHAGYFGLSYFVFNTTD